MKHWNIKKKLVCLLKLFSTFKNCTLHTAYHLKFHHVTNFNLCRCFNISLSWIAAKIVSVNFGGNALVSCVSRCK